MLAKDQPGLARRVALAQKIIAKTQSEEEQAEYDALMESFNKDAVFHYNPMDVIYRHRNNLIALPVKTDEQERELKALVDFIAKYRGTPEASCNRNRHYRMLQKRRKIDALQREAESRREKRPRVEVCAATPNDAELPFTMSPPCSPTNLPPWAIRPKRADGSAAPAAPADE
jgi:hypothetical protein